MKLTLGIFTLAMSWVVIPPVLAGAPQAKQNPVAESATDAVVYSNTKYGFTFSLPQSWKGYTIVADKWEASDAQKGVVERGPIVCIRHPEWSKENPRQDIPIMVFTSAQWESVEKGDYFAGAGAIRPIELGRNRKYAFAIPRHFDEAEVAGVKEVDELLQHEPLRPFWSK
jgi:hypothetical protein